jgi:hypothetical protein
MGHATVENRHGQGHRRGRASERTLKARDKEAGHRITAGRRIERKKENKRNEIKRELLG